MSIIGSSLEAVRRDLKYMPTQTLIQYKQNPAKNAVDGIPMDMLAGLELSRRAQMQNELAAAGAQGAANMPTVTDAAAQQLTGQPQQPPAPMPQGAPQPAPQPQQAQPPRLQVPQQPIPPTDAQVQQGPMQQTPQGGLPTVKKARGGFIIDSPDDLYNLLNNKRDLLKTEGYAGGGIIAFNGERKSDVPDAEEATSTAGDALRKAWQWIVDTGNPEKNPREREARATERAYRTEPGIFEAVTPSERKAREAEAEKIRSEIAASKGNKQIPIGDAASTPGLPPPMEESPSDSAKLLDSIIKRMGQGGGGGVGKISVPDIKIPPPPDLSAGIAAVRGAARISPEESAAIAANKKFATDLESRKSPFMTDAERAAAEDVQFKKRQEIYDPVNAETQKVLDERKAALEARRGRRLSEAGLQLGLGMLGGRGNLASIISGAGKEAVGAYQKGQELDDAQNERIQDMHLKQQQALAAQKAGNMDLAYQRTREAQADKLAIDKYELDKSQLGLGAVNKAAEAAAKARDRDLEVAKYTVDVDKALKYQQLGFNVDKELAELKMGVTLKLAQMQQANDREGMRQMLQIYGMLQKGEAAKIPTTADMERASRMIKDEYATADSPAVAAFVRGRENPDLATKYAQALRDARSGTATIAEPAAAFLYNVQKAAKQSAMQDILRRSRTSSESSGGVRDYSDVANAFGIGR